MCAPSARPSKTLQGGRRLQPAASNFFDHRGALSSSRQTRPGLWVGESDTEKEGAIIHFFTWAAFPFPFAAFAASRFAFSAALSALNLSAVTLPTSTSGGTGKGVGLCCAQ